MSPLAGWVEPFLASTLADGSLAIGVQLSVRHRGVEHVAVLGVGGTGRALSGSTRMRAYCAAKPLVAVGLQSALLEVGYDIDSPIGDAIADRLVGFPDHVGDYSCRDLLVHQTTMLAPRGAETHLLTGDRYLAECARRARESDRGTGYSEVSGWLLLSEVAEAITGRPGSELLEEHLIARVGLGSTTFGASDAAVREIAVHVEANVSLRQGERVPMLSDRSPRNLRRYEPAYGGYSSASDLSRFYEWMLHPRHLDGSADVAAETLVELVMADRRERRWDPGLELECAFGRGLMVGLDDFAIGTATSDAAFGHSGFIGTAFGFADPVADLAVGCIFVGITDASSTAEYLRPTLVDMIYREVCG